MRIIFAVSTLCALSANSKRLETFPGGLAQIQANVDTDSAVNVDADLETEAGLELEAELGADVDIDTDMLPAPPDPPPQPDAPKTQEGQTINLVENERNMQIDICVQTNSR